MDEKLTIAQVKQMLEECSDRLNQILENRELLANFLNVDQSLETALNSIDDCIEELEEGE
jgi:hypothetical protein